MADDGVQVAETGMQHLSGHDAQAPWVFQHHQFRRGQPDLLTHIKRTSPKTAQGGDNATASPESAAAGSPAMMHDSQGSSASAHFIPYDPHADLSNRRDYFQLSRSHRVAPPPPVAVHPSATNYGGHRVTSAHTTPSATPQPMQSPTQLANRFYEDRFAALENNVRVLSTALFETNGELDRLREHNFHLFRMLADLLPPLVDPSLANGMDLTMQRRYTRELRSSFVDHPRS